MYLVNTRQKSKWVNKSHFITDYYSELAFDFHRETHLCAPSTVSWLILVPLTDVCSPDTDGCVCSGMLQV